jgi:hypothetical protein
MPEHQQIARHLHEHRGDDGESLVCPVVPPPPSAIGISSDDADAHNSTPGLRLPRTAAARPSFIPPPPTHTPSSSLSLFSFSSSFIFIFCRFRKSIASSVTTLPAAALRTALAARSRKSASDCIADARDCISLMSSPSTTTSNSTRIADRIL